VVNRNSGSKRERVAKRTLSEIAVLGCWRSADAQHPNLRHLRKRQWLRPSYTSILTPARRSRRTCINTRPPTSQFATPITMVRLNVFELDQRAASSYRVDLLTNR
jgi:hypothetical protein